MRGHRVAFRHAPRISLPSIFDTCRAARGGQARTSTSSSSTSKARLTDFRCIHLTRHVAACHAQIRRECSANAKATPMKTVEPSAPRFSLRRFSPLSRSTRSVALGLVMVFAIGATAVGSVPSADGRIFACYSSSNMRIIDKEAGDTCRKGERQFEWNQIGPRGPQGIQGEPGPQGPPGSGGQEVATHVWVEDLRNIPTTLEVDSDDLVPEGARLKAHRSRCLVLMAILNCETCPPACMCRRPWGTAALRTSSRAATRSTGRTARSGRLRLQPSCTFPSRRALTPAVCSSRCGSCGLRTSTDVREPLTPEGAARGGCA